MLDEKASQLKAVLWMQFTYVDLATGRPSRHADELMQLLQSVQVEGFEPGFDSRAGELRAQFRDNRRQKEPSQHSPTAFVPQANKPQVQF